jgi:hypothetical protein
MPLSLIKKKGKNMLNEAENALKTDNSQKDSSISDDIGSPLIDPKFEENLSENVLIITAIDDPNSNAVVILDSGIDDINNIEVLPLDHRSERDLLIEEVRESLSEEHLTDSSSQVLPGTAYDYKNKKPIIIQKIEDWLSERVKSPSLPRQEEGARKFLFPARIIIFLLALVCLFYLIVFIKNKLISSSPLLQPTLTLVPTFSIPVPFSVEFPGGWTMSLSPSYSLFPNWNPTQPEWMNGTILCKLIAIPWNKQIDAVFKTIVPGDKINLTMSNLDQFVYQVESLKTVTTNTLTEMINRNSPCMVVFLYIELSTSSQALTALPSSP